MPAPPPTPPAPGKAPPAERRRAARLYARLEALYPEARCALHHRSPWELLVATILSAQCTDKRVNMVTPALFEALPTPRAMAEAPQAQVESLIRTTGFYRNKAKALRGAARAVVEHHGSEVPRTMDKLLALPGVARKTANVVLGNAFGINHGVVVDTHVGRLARRLGLTTHQDPAKVEKDLAARFPRDKWAMLAHLLIEHGRAVCKAQRPRCSACALRRSCPQVGVENPA